MLMNLEDEDQLDLTDLAQNRLSVRSRFHEIKNYHKQNANPDNVCDDDKFLSDLVKALRIKSLVVGVGGAGNNTVSRLEDMGISDAETLNINTDAHDLYYSNAKHKILIGKERCNGLGSGNDPSVGAEAAEEDRERIRKKLNADIIFLTCGLGGGTGTGAAPIIAQEAKKNNCIVVTFCSLPFKSEGDQRLIRANSGLKNLGLPNAPPTTILLLNLILPLLISSQSFLLAFTMSYGSLFLSLVSVIFIAP